MKAMILAAGLGKRMRPLTEHTPKPLLAVAGRCLIEFHLEKLAQAGFKEVVINTHWLAQQIPATLGNGDKWGLKLHYSYEAELLETAGGIFQALPMLVDDKQHDCFLVLNSDVYCDLDLSAWLSAAPELSASKNAYLALVENPEHHLKGDFSFDSSSGLLAVEGEFSQALTYSGIALFHPSFFDGMTPGPAPLGRRLKQAVASGSVRGCLLTDFWLDVGTPERFDLLTSRLA
jgi:MurNAc alpha-1-phosphate uridylyltransferase